MKKRVPKTIVVFGPDNIYLSHCTWSRALKLLQSKRAIRINATTIRLIHSKSERIKKKHKIIEQENRICYICHIKIPETEIATIDHVIPKSRNNCADVYDNMRCCCSRCNNDKGNMTLSEYVSHIIANRSKYDYISENRLLYLKNFAKYYEENFYDTINHTSEKERKHYNKHRKRGRK